MNKWHLSSSILSGEISLPTSKSQSIRALVFALMGKGKSVISNLLPSPDVDAMISACRMLGCRLNQFESHVEIEGLDGRIDGSEDVINAKNSGLVLRFVGALSSLSSLPIVLTGDDSIRNRRPVKPLLEALSQLGVQAISTKSNSGAPIIIQGPIQSGRLSMCGKDSQPVSGMLIASAFAPGPIELAVTNPGEKPWVDLTLNWFDRLGISYSRKGYEFYRVEGQSRYAGFSYEVPADLSSMAFPIAAALITQSEIALTNIDLDDPQGDKIVLDVFKKMGACIEIEQKNIFVKKGGELKGLRIDVNNAIDSLPILAVLGCFASGKTEIIGAEIARCKESDRISAITSELKKMGARIEEHKDGMTIFPSQLQGARLESHSDHRIAMALAVAALAAKGESVVQGVECVSKSYPNFNLDMKKLGAKIV